MDFFKKLEYIRRLIITTPYYLIGIFFNLLSSIFIILGIPMLLPALDYLNDGVSNTDNAIYTELSSTLFDFFAITPTFSSTVIFASVLIIVSQVLLFFIEAFNIKVQIKIIKSYMRRLIEGYFSVKWSWLANDKSGAFHSAISREVGLASEAHLDSQRIVTSFLQVIVYVVISLTVSVEVTLIVIIFFTMIFVMNVMFSNKVNSFSRNYNNSFISLSSLISEISSNKKFFKYSNSSLFINIVLEKIKSVNFLSWRLNLLVTFLSSISITLGMVLIMVILLFHRDFGLNSSEIMILFLVFARLAPQFSSLAGNYVRISERMPVHKSINDRIQAVRNNYESFGQINFNPNNDIQFEKVCFNYGSISVINDVSLKIKPLSTTAFVGGSGAGKSTLLDLILGLIKPSSGDIKYGGILQNDLNLKSFREKVAYISQNVTLLDGSLLFNLTINNMDASIDQVLESCKKAHLLNFIEGLPDKFETMIGENGIKLSGGQRQRIALARALINNPKVLILDEATSQLDSETEKFIQSAIDDFQGSLTVIIVAHRLSTIKHADIVHVLENGRIVESGTYSNLLKAQGRLYELDKLQSD